MEPRTTLDSEIVFTMQKPKTSMAAGEDDIPGDIVKAGISVLAESLH